MSAVLPETSFENARSVIFPSTRYELNPPNILQDVSKSINNADSMVSNDVVLTVTPNAKAWFNGVDALILDANDEEIFKYGNINKQRIDSAAEQTYLSGTSLILGAAGAHCYYHWMVDVLPKLKVLQQAGIDLDSIDHFILRDLDLDFQAKTLQILGVPRTKIFLSKGASNFKTDLLFHVELRNFVGMKMHDFIPKFLCESFLKKEQCTEHGRKIYITRPAGVNRPIDNESELLKLVTAHGYECVVMEGMALNDQAQLFHSASSIITTHGGALTNIVYSKPGTKIIELFGEHVFSYYYGLSNLCKLEYTAILKSVDQYSLVVDPFAGNEMSNQHITIRQGSGINTAALSLALDRAD